MLEEHQVDVDAQINDNKLLSDMTPQEFDLEVAQSLRLFELTRSSMCKHQWSQGDDDTHHFIACEKCGAELSSKYQGRKSDDI